MISISSSKTEERGALIVAPAGRDAALMSTVLMDAGIRTTVASDSDGIDAEVLAATSLVLLTEESLTPTYTQDLLEAIHGQPAWSDIPLLILASGTETYGSRIDFLTDLFEDRGNVTVIERPIRIKRFLAAVRAALSARRNQLQIRDHIESLNASQSRLEAALKEKALLLREVHHRVKNNLQVICGFLQMAQNSQYKTAPEVLLESEQRVLAMAMVHEQLHQSDDLTCIDFADYVRSLAERLTFSGNDAFGRIALSCHTDPITMSLDQAIPCGLILNELISNAMKHAFPANRTGVLSVSANEDGSTIRLCVTDDGVGVQSASSFEAKPTTGMLIVKILSKQLNGELTLPMEGGSTFGLTFSKH